MELVIGIGPLGGGDSFCRVQGGWNSSRRASEILPGLLHADLLAVGSKKMAQWKH